MFRVSGTRNIVEYPLRVEKFRRILEPGDPGRGCSESDRNADKRLVQFYARDGGMRTVAVDDIVEVR